MAPIQQPILKGYNTLNNYNLSAAERVLIMWTAAIFFGHGGRFLKKSKIKLQNFTTSNTYLCIEINARAIVNAILNLPCKVFHQYTSAAKSVNIFFGSCKLYYTD